MLSLLKQALDDKRLLSVFLHRERPSFANVGRVVKISEKYLALSAVAPDGRWDGYLLCHIDSLYKIEGDSPYEKKVELLNYKRGEAEERYSLEFKKDGDFFEEVLFEIFDKKIVVGIGFQESDELIYGMVAAIEGGFLQISILDEFGQNDGYAIVCREDIDSIEVYSVDCRTLEYLRDHFHQKG